MPEDPDKPDEPIQPVPLGGDASASAPAQCGKRRPVAGWTVFCYPASDAYRLDVLNDQDVDWGY